MFVDLFSSLICCHIWFKHASTGRLHTLYQATLVHTPQLIFLEIIYFFQFHLYLCRLPLLHIVQLLLQNRRVALTQLARGVSVAALIPNNAHMSRSVTCLTTSGPQLLRSHKLQVPVDYRSPRSAAPLVPLYACPYLHSSGILVQIFKVIGGGHLNMPLN